MVYKLCAVCGRYFTGELNGDYHCTACAPSQGEAVRPLAGLDGSVIGIETLAGFQVGEAGGARPPGREDRRGDAAASASHSQAA